MFYTLYSIKNNTVSMFESLYYGIFKKDGFSRTDANFYFHRILSDMLTPYYNIKNGLKNIIKYLPIIWNDRQFDYNYLLILLEHKLKLTEEFFNSDEPHILEAKRVADEVKHCKDILHQLINTTYEDKYWDKLNKKYPERKEITFIPAESEKERVEQGLPPRMYKMNAPDRNDEYHTDIKHMFELIEKERKDLYNDLFNTINTNIEGWWD